MPKRPNFLIIVADDLGFSDVQPYGSEISTPNLQWLADTGIRMSDFHTAPTCSPTRSMLMSGTDNHIAGLGAMWEQMRGMPDLFKGRRGYEGYLNFDVAALPEVLREGGYWTVMSGKWHLGMKKEIAPCSRGFDKVFTYLAGAGNHFNHEPQLEEGIPRLPSLIGTGLWMEGDKFLDRSTELPKDFYSSKSFVDYLLNYFKNRTQAEKEKPFFAYLPFTAPHWPLQAPKETIAKYRGQYNSGPDGLRWQRLASLQKRKLVPEGVEPAPVEADGTKEWKDMTPEQQAKSSRSMEVFAGMVDEMDAHIGRVLEYLRDTDELDNTFILFMSDNGAEGHILEAFPVLQGVSLADVLEKHYDNSLENMGTATSYIWYGPRWASAGTAPSRAYKTYTTEGGIRCPCIVRYPPGIKLAEGSITHALTNVMDIMPTMLELAGVPHPGERFQGRTVVPMRGRSWVPLVTGAAERVYESFDYTGWELFGMRAVRKGKWKAVLLPAPKHHGEWELYDLEKDPGEVNDLAEKQPEKLKELIAHYEVYYQETGMFDATLAIEMSMKKQKDILELKQFDGVTCK